jgi:hypothetical protein
LIMSFGYLLYYFCHNMHLQNQIGKTSAVINEQTRRT